MGKLSLVKNKPIRYIPTRHDNALRLLFDPYRQQRAGWNNNKISNLIIDYSKGGVISSSNLFTNCGYHGGTDWVDTDSNGVADNWTVYANMTGSIVTGNGFKGNAQRCVYTDGEAGYLRNVIIDDNIGAKFRIRFKYRSSQLLKFGNGVNVTWAINTGDAIQIDYIVTGTFDGSILTRFYLTGHSATDWFEIGELSFVKLENGYQGEAKGDLHTTGWGSDTAGIELDGVNDYIDFEDSFQIGYNSFIVFGWIKNPDIRETGFYKTSLSKSQDTANNFWLRHQTGRLYTYAEISNVLHSNFSNALLLTTNNTWYCMAIAVDREGATDDMIMNYVNGSQDIPGSKNWFDENDNHSNSGHWVVGDTVTNGHIGITGVYLFDGQYGAPSSMPSDYETLVSEIYTTMLPLYT